VTNIKYHSDGLIIKALIIILIGGSDSDSYCYLDDINDFEEPDIDADLGNDFELIEPPSKKQKADFYDRLLYGGATISISKNHLYTFRSIHAENFYF